MGVLAAVRAFLPRLAGASRERIARSVEGPGGRCYPPFDSGINVVAVRELLAEHGDLLERIRIAYGGEEGGFEERLLPLVQRYASVVHLLPATADGHFCGEGGLLRLGLEVGFHALQAADGQIFSPTSTVPERRALEPRWRTATFIAGLCAELHCTLAAVVVAGPDGEQWCPFVAPLADWLAAGRYERYFVRWVKPAKGWRGAGIFVLPHIVTPGLAAYLSEQNHAVMPHMMASLTGVPFNEYSALEVVVRRTVSLVVDRNLKTGAGHLGVRAGGASLERYLLDALRCLARSESWQPNRAGTRVWSGLDGLFLVWPDAVNDVVKLLQGDRVPGIPRAAETIAEALRAMGAVQPRGEDELLWRIKPAGNEEALPALRISNPALLYGLDTASALPIQLASAALDGNGEKQGDARAPLCAALTLDVAPTEDAHKTLERVMEPDAAVILAAGVEEHASGEEHASDSSADESEHREIVLPPELNPLVAESLRAILADCAGGVAKNDDLSELFIPLAHWRDRGLETGTVVRALHEAGLLVLQGERKVTRRVVDGAEELGVVLSPKLLARPALSDALV